MFHPLDLIMPIGSAIVAVTLCVIGAIKADKVSAKVVSIATGVVFAASVPAWYFVRWSANRADFETSQGVRVRQGDTNKCQQADIEAWTAEMITFWNQHCPPPKVREAVKHVFVVCTDKPKLSLFDKWVKGWEWYGTIALAKLPEIGALYKHEISHTIMEQACGIPVDHHHQKMKDLHLGY